MLTPNALPVKGTLKGYDALMNLVLDDVDEVVRGMSQCTNYSFLKKISFEADIFPLR